MDHEIEAALYRHKACHNSSVTIHREAENADDHVTKGPRPIARKLVDKTIDGDVPAIEEIRGRLGGEALQDPIGADGERLKNTFEWKSSGS